MFNIIKSIVWYILFTIDIIFFIIRFGFFENTKNIHISLKKVATRNIKRASIKTEVIGKENLSNEPFLFVANHQSYFDVMLLMAFIPHKKGFVAKIEFLKIPFVKKLTDKLNFIFLDRGNLRQNNFAILKGIDILKNGHSLVVFPEGTWRWEDHGTMLPFKRGSFKLATKSGASIIPVSIINAHKIAPMGSPILRPTKVTIIIHKKIETKNLTHEENIKLPYKIHEIINIRETPI